MTELHLGIDIGTTSIKVCLKSGLDTVSSSRRSHNAYYRTFVSTDHPAVSLFREQDPVVLLETLDACMNSLKIISSNQKVHSVSVTGQMHGVVLWKRKQCDSDQVKRKFADILRACVESYSNLITWEDQRCDRIFLESLPKSEFSPTVATGYGLASLLWLHRNKKPGVAPISYHMCGTIMDFIVWLLTQSENVLMTPHNAKSWGYFDGRTRSWDFDALNKEENFNSAILPKIVEIGQCVGKSMFSCIGITKDFTNVYGALGDMQCSIRSCHPTHEDAVLNIGTSSQLSFIIKKDKLEVTSDQFCLQHPALDIVPYLHDEIIITAASLTGGNVLIQFAKTLIEWSTQLGCQNIPNVGETLSKMASLSMQNTDTKSSLQIIPRIYGERYEAQSTASVMNITTNNLSLSSTVSTLYKGIAENLQTMMPRELLKHYGIQRILGTGGTLFSHVNIQKFITEVFGLPLSISKDGDAAEGAAIFARGFYNN